MLIKLFIKSVGYSALYVGSFWFVYLPICALSANGCKFSGDNIVFFVISLGLMFVSTLLFFITLIVINLNINLSKKYLKLEPIYLFMVGIGFPFTFFLITGQVNSFFYPQGFWLHTITASVVVAFVAFLWGKKNQ